MDRAVSGAFVEFMSQYTGFARRTRQTLPDQWEIASTAPTRDYVDLAKTLLPELFPCGLFTTRQKGVTPVYTNPQKLPQNGVLELRQQAGRWLKELRETRRLSQRGLADRVGAEYYTFISQIEAGRGRIPPDRYEAWATALDVEPKAFVQKLLRYYDPLTHAIVFGDV